MRAESKLCDQSHYRNYYLTFPIRLPSAMSCVACCYYVCFENFGLNSEAINALRCVPYVVFELKYRVKTELYLPAAAQSVPMLCIHWIERLNAPIRNQKKRTTTSLLEIRNKLCGHSSSGTSINSINNWLSITWLPELHKNTKSKTTKPLPVPVSITSLNKLKNTVCFLNDVLVLIVNLKSEYLLQITP